MEVVQINLKKYIKNKDYVRNFEKGKEYVFSYEAYQDYCTAKRYHKIDMYKKMDKKKVKVRHSKGAELITGAKGAYPNVIFVKPYWCREV